MAPPTMREPAPAKPREISFVRSIACSATAVSIHLAVAAGLTMMPPRTHAAKPPAPHSEAVLVPFEPAVEEPPEPPPAEEEVVVVEPEPVRRKRIAPPKVVADKPPEPPPVEEPAEPEAPPAPAAGAPSESAGEAPGITSSEGGLAVAGGAGRGGQGGTSRTFGEAGGTGEKPAVDRRALLSLYRRMLDEAIATPPPVRGIRDPLDVTVVVALTIDANGRLVRARLNRSSGYPGIDEHALEFLSSIRDLPAPPEALEWKKGTVLYPIRVIVR